MEAPEAETLQARAVREIRGRDGAGSREPLAVVPQGISVSGRPSPDRHRTATRTAGQGGGGHGHRLRRATSRHRGRGSRAPRGGEGRPPRPAAPRSAPHANVDEDEPAAAESYELPGTDLSDEELVVEVQPQRADEFVCSACFLVHHRAAQAGPATMLCPVRLSRSSARSVPGIGLGERWALRRERVRCHRPVMRFPSTSHRTSVRSPEPIAARASNGHELRARRGRSCGSPVRARTLSWVACQDVVAVEGKGPGHRPEDPGADWLGLRTCPSAPRSRSGA